MHVNLKVSISGEYFSQTNREIDWEEEGDSTKVSPEQAEELQKILATEVSVFLLRGATGFCGSLIDSMISVRRNLINEYQDKYEPYVEYNDFY